MNLRMLNEIKYLAIAGLLSLGSLPARGQGPIMDPGDETVNLPNPINCNCRLVYMGLLYSGQNAFEASNCSGQPARVDVTVLSPDTCASHNGRRPGGTYNRNVIDGDGYCARTLNSTVGDWSTQDCQLGSSQSATP